MMSGDEKKIFRVPISISVRDRCYIEHEWIQASSKEEAQKIGEAIAKYEEVEHEFRHAREPEIKEKVIERIKKKRGTTKHDMKAEIEEKNEEREQYSLHPIEPPEALKEVLEEKES